MSMTNAALKRLALLLKRGIVEALSGNVAYALGNAARQVKADGDVLAITETYPGMFAVTLTTPHHSMKAETVIRNAVSSTGKVVGASATISDTRLRCVGMGTSRRSLEQVDVSAHIMFAHKRVARRVNVGSATVAVGANIDNVAQTVIANGGSGQRNESASYGNVHNDARRYKTAPRTSELGGTAIETIATRTRKEREILNKISAS